MAASNLDVRFTPESGHVRCKQECPLSANSGHHDLRNYNPRSTEIPQQIHQLHAPFGAHLFDNSVLVLFG